MRHIILLFLIVFIKLNSSKAQVPQKAHKKDIGLIIGNIVDAKTGKAIAFASVTIAKKIDSTQKITDVADKNGSFEFERLSLGYYCLTVKAIGYNITVIDSIYLRTERYDFNLGDVKINSAASTSLDEVVVYSEKPLIENKDGKITYNIGESALSNGSSTSEILKNMPLVSNDPNGKILLKGKEPKILIDDKPTDLSADQLKDLLESLPGSSIEKIELMTNPPPQYATEQGGVINIVTKKGKIGLTGKSTISAGTRGEGSFSTNVSYRLKQFSNSNVIGISTNNFKGINRSSRQNFYKSGISYNNTNSNWVNKNTRPSLRNQLDFEINKRNSINFIYQGNLNFFDNSTATEFTNLDSLQRITKLSKRDNGSNGNGYNHSFTLSYTWKGKNPNNILRGNINGNFGKNDNGKDYYQQFLDQNYNPTSDSLQSQFYNSYNSGGSVRLNYDALIIKGLNLTTGTSFQRSNNHNLLNTSFFNKQDSSFVNNDLLSSDFRFNQDIFTARAAIILTVFADVKLIAGSQFEQTNTNFIYQKGNAKNNSSGYNNMLCNVTIRKEFDKTFNTAIIYRASIKRPGLGELNPNIDYSDNNNIRFGNPNLMPSTSDNIDFNCSWIKGKYYINTSLGYNKVKDVYYQIRTLLDGGKTQATWQNIATRQEYEASVWGGYTFTKRFRINTSFGYTYNQYSETEKKLFKYQDGASFYTSLNYTYTPTNLLNFEGNFKFSSFADPQGRSKSNLSMNIGIQRKFFQKRLIIGINIVDPITMQQFTTYTYGSNFTTENYSSANTRNYRLTVAYQLNKLVQKSKLSNKDQLRAIRKLSSTPKMSNQ